MYNYDCLRIVGGEVHIRCQTYESGKSRTIEIHLGPPSVIGNIIGDLQEAVKQIKSQAITEKRDKARLLRELLLAHQTELNEIENFLDIHDKAVVYPS